MTYGSNDILCIDGNEQIAFLRVLRIPVPYYNLLHYNGGGTSYFPSGEPSQKGIRRESTWRQSISTAEVNRERAVSVMPPQGKVPAVA